MISIGIDPGKSGCLCLLKDNFPTFYDWPKDGNYIDYFNKLRRLLLSEKLNDNNVSLIVLERVHAMSGQGVSSTFSFGMNYGMWQGFLATLPFSVLLVTPQTWMKGLISKADGPDTKTAVRNVAKRLFPNVELQTPRGKYLDGRGDALLMAYYASLQRN